MAKMSAKICEQKQSRPTWLRRLVREEGGAQNLITQVHTLKSLVDKAGGLEELELSVSEVRAIRDTLGEHGSQGLSGLASEIQGLLESKRKYAALQLETDGPNGLRTNAINYDSLMQVVTVQQPLGIPQQASYPIRQRMPGYQQPTFSSSSEDAANRGVYDSPLPFAQPKNTDRGDYQDEEMDTQVVVGQLRSNSSTLKRTMERDVSSASSKRPCTVGIVWNSPTRPEVLRLEH
jgi:hypothetical protein